MPEPLQPTPDAPAVPQPDPLLGKVLDARFTILERIGSGGMGRVYKARQAPLDRIVALKVLNPRYGGDKDPNFKRRFFLEASLTGKLRHPNTIQIIDYGEVGEEIYYIAMEYLEGNTLSALLSREGALAWQRVLNIAQQAARSLREAHRHGVIHRDLKPANIMLVHEEPDHDLVKVLDFGLVKAYREDAGEALKDVEMTQAGVILGSAQYMAPEQAHGQGDPRSDVYSLGVVMFHMLMGRPPFQAPDSMDIIVKHHTQAPPRFGELRPDLDVPTEVEALVQRCLAKRPENRFAGMDELLEAMRSLIGRHSTGMVGISRSQTGTVHFVSPDRASGPTTASRLVVTVDVPSESGPTQPNAPRRSVGLMAAAVFAGALFIGGAIALVAWPRKAESPPAPVAAPTPAVAAPTPAPLAPAAAPSVPAAPRNVQFVVESEPTGATVTREGRELGTTPLVFSLPADATGQASAEVTLALEGYLPVTVTASGAGPELKLEQKLKRRPAPPPRRSRGGGSGGSYKDDPY